MRFTFSGHRNSDGSWGLDVEVPNGGTVLFADVIDTLVVASAQLVARRSERVPTIAEVAAIKAAEQDASRLPDGWAPSLDAVDITDMIGGPRVYSTRFVRSDGHSASVPCAENGAPIPATRQALLTYDAEHPPQLGAEA